MSEFKLHTLISDLIVVLESSHSPEKFIENIQINVITLENIPSKNSISYLEKNSVTNELFLKKYNELKGKKFDGLGSFIQVLYHISLDKSLKNYLAKYRIKNNSKLPLSLAITNDDLPTIHKNILKATNEREKQATKKIHGFNKPTETTFIKYNWCYERPKITWDYYSDIKLTPYIKVVPAVSQETILIWDLLNCLKGIDGNYIVSESLSDINDRRTFTISTDVSTPYKQLVQQILPLASCYSTTIRFVEDKILPNDGQVNHALRGAMNYMLKDYLLFIVQLEMEHLRNKLNLQNLWFYIQPIMSTMSILAQITTILLKVIYNSILLTNKLISIHFLRLKQKVAKY